MPGNSFPFAVRVGCQNDFAGFLGLVDYVGDNDFLLRNYLIVRNETAFDIDGVLADFAPVPYQALPYRSILVASNNDPYCPVRTAGAYARAWGSEFVRLQDAGQTDWDDGQPIANILRGQTVTSAALPSHQNCACPLARRSSMASMGQNAGLLACASRARHAA